MARELQPARYDVGAIVRDYTQSIIGVSPNLATPATWIEVLDVLNHLTGRLEAADKLRVLKQAAKETPGGVLTGPPPDDQITIDLSRWRIRLDDYMLTTHAAKDELDRKAVLWEVTAPLLLGWHGGPTGTEVALPSGGYPDGFNTAAQHGPDIATPYSLANQLGVWEDWRRRRTELLVTDMKAAAESVIPDLPKPGGVPWWAWMAAGAGALILIKKT